MAKIQSRQKADGSIVVIEDVPIRGIANYVTISELRHMLKVATGRDFPWETVIYWIYQGWVPARKAGDGRTAAWLIHKKDARAFVEIMVARHTGEILDQYEAAAYLGEKIGRNGPVSTHTMLSWVHRGLLAAASPGISAHKFSKTELDAFAAWFNEIKVWRYGRWCVPSRASRIFWQRPNGEDAGEVGHPDQRPDVHD